VAENNQLIGFFIGFVIAVLITGFILTKNPRHIPLILRYSTTESFARIANQGKHSKVYYTEFSHFLKVYTQVRIVFYVSFIVLCIMIATTVLVYRP